MKRIWIKAYIEILDDPKMGRLPDWLWRRAIELFLLAGENGNDGLLRPVVEMAWRLRISEDDLVKSLRALSEVGVVHETPEGWMVTHFKDRQAALTGAERVQAFRERKRNEGVTKSYIESNEVVVSSSTSTFDSLERGGGMGEEKTFSAFGDQSLQVAGNLFSKITGQPTFPPAWENKYIRALADVLYGQFDRDVSKAAASAKPVFTRWCNTRSKSNGTNYQRTGSGWVDWWIAELAPKPDDKGAGSILDRIRLDLEGASNGK